MGRVLGFVGLLIALGIGWMVYQRQIKTLSGGEGAQATPRGTIDLAGVRNDLVSLANAERQQMASSGKYKSLDELRSDGDTTMSSTTRGPYTYTIETTSSSFRITATRGPSANGGPQLLSIDETMIIKQE